MGYVRYLKIKRRSSGGKGFPGTMIALGPTNVYLLLTEFEVRTVSYGPSFFPFRFMARAGSARAINRREKKRICNLQYGPRRQGY